MITTRQGVHAVTNSWCIQLSKNVLQYVKNKLNGCRKKKSRGQGGTDTGSAGDMACAPCISHMHAQESLSKLLACVRSFWLLASSNSVLSCLCHVKLIQMFNKIGSVI